MTFIGCHSCPIWQRFFLNKYRCSWEWVNKIKICQNNLPGIPLWGPDCIPWFKLARKQGIDCPTLLDHFLDCLRFVTRFREAVEEEKGETGGPTWALKMTKKTWSHLLSGCSGSWKCNFFYSKPCQIHSCFWSFGNWTKKTDFSKFGCSYSSWPRRLKPNSGWEMGNLCLEIQVGRSWSYRKTPQPFVRPADVPGAPSTIAGVIAEVKLFSASGGTWPEIAKDWKQLNSTLILAVLDI